MLARMAVARLGNGLGRSWSAADRPSPLSESSSAFLGTASMLQGGRSETCCSGHFGQSICCTTNV